MNTFIVDDENNNYKKTSNLKRKRNYSIEKKESAWTEDYSDSIKKKRRVIPKNLQNSGSSIYSTSNTRPYQFREPGGVVGFGEFFEQAQEFVNERRERNRDARPPMNNNNTVRKPLVPVEQTVGSVRKPLIPVEQTLGSVRKPLIPVEQTVGSVRRPLEKVEREETLSFNKWAPENKKKQEPNTTSTTANPESNKSNNLWETQTLNSTNATSNTKQPSFSTPFSTPAAEPKKNMNPTKTVTEIGPKPITPKDIKVNGGGWMDLDTFMTTLSIASAFAGIVAPRLPAGIEQPVRPQRPVNGFEMIEGELLPVRPVERPIQQPVQPQRPVNGFEMIEGELLPVRPPAEAPEEIPMRRQNLPQQQGEIAMRREIQPVQEAPENQAPIQAGSGKFNANKLNVVENNIEGLFHPEIEANIMANDRFIKNIELGNRPPLRNLGTPSTTLKIPQPVQGALVAAQTGNAPQNILDVKKKLTV